MTNQENLFKKLKPYIGKLVRGIDRLADENGGKGECHDACEAALKIVMSSLQRMSEGKR